MALFLVFQYLQLISARGHLHKGGREGVSNIPGESEEEEGGGRWRADSSSGSTSF